MNINQVKSVLLRIALFLQSTRQYLIQINGENQFSASGRKGPCCCSRFVWNFVVYKYFLQWEYNKLQNFATKLTLMT